MDNKINILLVQGSLRRKSSTATMLYFLEKELNSIPGAQSEIYDFRTHELPLLRPDEMDKSENYQLLANLVGNADAIVLGSPDYHGTPSGVIKNFLDYFWHEFAGKLFGYVCASHEKGLTTMDILRVAIRQCYGWSLPYGVSGMDEADITPEVEVTNEKLRSRLTMMAHDLVNYGRVLRQQRETDLNGNHPSFLARYRE